MKTPRTVAGTLRSVRWVLTLVLLVGVPTLTPASAATIAVNTPTDEDAGNGLCSLREAIIAANTNAAYNGCSAGNGPSDVITLSAGTYTLDPILGQLPVVASTITINGNLRTNTFVQASTCDPVTLPGACTPAEYRVLEVGGVGSLTLNTLTVRRGNCVNTLACASSEGNPDNYKGRGGGILNFGILRLNNSSLLSNKSANDGGGIYQAQGTLSMTGTDVLDNSAGNSGGGISANGAVTLTSGNFSGNASVVGGGAISTSGGSLTVTGMNFASNSANADGGAISSGGTLTVDKSTFHDNSAVRGGGIFNSGGGPNTVTNSTIHTNTASGNGGGIFNFEDLNVTNSTFSGNSALAGGAFYSDPYQHENDQFRFAAVTLKNTILANSTGGDDCFNFRNGALVPITGITNLIEADSAAPNACGTTAPINNTDPKLGTLTGFPLPQYYPLLAGSPAIDAGDNATCLAPPVSNTSQSGVTRPQGARCDIGAFEASTNTAPTISDVTNQTMAMNTVTAALPVTVGDLETPPASLVLTGTSSNTTLVPNANIAFGGSGANRTVTVTPAASQTGVTTVTLTVTDGGGLTATNLFTVTVATSPTTPPTISDVANQTIAVNTATAALPVTVSGLETPFTTLVLAGTSSNTTLVPNASIVFGGSGANRTATVTPAANQTGTTTVTLTVMDGVGLTATDTFTVTVAGTTQFTRYLAEGATSSFFDTRVALLNPGTTATTATMTFARSGSSAVTTQVAVPARERVTVDAKTIAGLATAEFSTRIDSDQPLIVDRTMTWDGRGYGAHAETAVAAPALTWYLAEGSTVGGFNLFYLLQNPNAAEAQVRVRFLRPSGTPLEKTYPLPANSRTTVWVNQEVFPGLGRALAASDVSAVIQSTNAQPIIVERSMYLDLPGQTFGAGHESAGVTAPATQWFLAEGATGPFFDLFVLVANPGDTNAQVEATYLLPSGTVIVKPYAVPANSRFNIWVDLEDARLADTAVSTTIRSTNGVPVIVERSMWWPGDVTRWYEAHNSPGATETGTRWALAEGEVGGPRGVDTYILVANATSTTGTVKVTLLFEGGTNAEKTFTVFGNSRFNVDARTEFPSALNKRFGAIVESQGATPAQIVVERAMYWNALGQTWAAGTNALATKLQ